MEQVIKDTGKSPLNTMELSYGLEVTMQPKDNYLPSMRNSRFSVMLLTSSSLDNQLEDLQPSYGQITLPKEHQKEPKYGQFQIVESSLTQETIFQNNTTTEHRSSIS